MSGSNRPTAGEGEAVAWLYEKKGYQSLQLGRQPWLTQPDRGWTETPLYAALSATQSSHTDLLVALERSRQGWANVIEFGLLPRQHRATAEELRDAADTAIAQHKGQSK